MNNQEKLRELEEENRQLKAALAQRETFIRRTFGSFLTDEVLEQILESGKTIKIGGERREVTILFSDLRRSTELSEQMDAVSFLRMLNHYLSEMIEIINAWQGNILEFMGDAIIAVFGAPRENEYAARDAVACAVAMQRRIPKINEWNLSRGYPALAMGVGIHTGEAILGNIGSETRMKYDMIGRNVNLASRVQGFTAGGQILVTDETLAAAGEQVKENAAGLMRVRPKGIQEEIRLHDVVGFGRKLLDGQTAQA